MTRLFAAQQSRKAFDRRTTQAVRSSRHAAKPNGEGPRRRIWSFIAGDVPNAIRLTVVLVAAAVGVAVVVLRSAILPRRFLLDSLQIQAIASGRLSSQGDKSFGNVAAVYRVLGLQDVPVVAGLLGYALALALLAVVLVQARGRLTWLATAAIVVTTGMSAVYLGTYSKDVLVLPIIALALCMRRGLVGEVVVVTSMLVYAEALRTYWFLVAGIFVVTKIVLHFTNRRLVVLLAAPIALLALALVVPLLTGQPSDFARTHVNESRGFEVASTTIHQFVSLPQPFGSLVNTELVLLTAVLPLPLLLRGGAYYYGSAAVFIVVWVAFFFGASHVALGSRAMRGVVFVAAFVGTQALFEPDYGSLLRHLTPMFPIFCLVALASSGIIGRRPASSTAASRGVHRSRAARRLQRDRRPI